MELYILKDIFYMKKIIINIKFLQINTYNDIVLKQKKYNK